MSEKIKMLMSLDIDELIDQTYRELALVDALHLGAPMHHTEAYESYAIIEGE